MVQPALGAVGSGRCKMVMTLPARHNLIPMGFLYVTSKFFCAYELHGIIIYV